MSDEVKEESQFNRKTTAYEVVEKVDLKNKVYVITGASNGIGKISAIAVALKGATVICCVRDVDKMNEVIKEEFLTDENKEKNLKKEQFVIYKVDLTDLKDVSKTAKAIAKKYPKIDGIVANAGVMFPPKRTETKDGFEYHLGVNYLAHFVLIHTLTENLINAKPSRVVVVSAIAHRWCKGINFEDVNLINDYEKFAAYGQSCAARCMFAIEFNKRYSNKGVIAFSLHPGIISTGLQKEFTQEDYEKLHMKDKDGNFTQNFVNNIAVTVEQGAATQVWALTSSSLDKKGGAFLQDCQIAPEWDGKPANIVGYQKYLYDETNCKKLWESTLKWVEKYL